MPNPTLTARYNPDPDTPYATCQDCGTELADRAAVDAHAKTIMDQQERPGVTLITSHTVHITNQSRTERIARAVATIVEDTLREQGDIWGRELSFNDDVDEEVTERVDYLIRCKDITRAEAESALRTADAAHIIAALIEETPDA